MKLIIGILYGTLATTLLSACGNEKGKYDATGTFEATEVIVSSEASGKLMDFNVTEGDLLQQGAEIGYVDTVQLYLKKLQLEANTTTVRSRKQDVNKQIAAIKQQIATQQREKNRFENLVKSNAANQKQVDDINAQIAYLQKQLAAQTSTLENNNAGVTGESSSLEIQIAQLEDQLRKCHITSPINGTVLSKYAEKGELATPGKALFKVADIGNMYLRAYITSDQLSKIKIGQKVKVFADYGADNVKEFPGTISWISNKSEFTPKGILTKDERANLVYAVKVAVKNSGDIKIGMYGEVSFTK
ncbi:HlyD family efflux transporter periplasmic adaptor subunit [uncultured Bacteroides sp.]|uniref:HlyD family secretion protein n=1 Tax=uncultured Bacteroides sp. TaxID=162156 RepID=UPI002AAB0083|nr:HlyD family efflux transporter periplasmic adaptor subunit [uncultured Bacteroides sp.]